MKKKTPYLFIILLAAFLAGCAKETPEQDEWLGPLPEGDALVTFSVRFPEPVVLGPATKAMADTPSISSLKIAVFGSSGFLKEYRDVESFTAATTNGPSPVYTFRTKMNLTDSKNLRVHIIANGPDKLPWLYEDAALCSGAYTTGTQDAYWCRFVLPNGVMAKREYNATTQAMEYVKRQDPVDEQWYFVVDDSVEALFQNLPLVRNFAKLTVESTTPQLVLNPTTTVAVVNVPDRGSVAPYNAETSQFMSGYKDISYADMINEYPGYTPDDMTITQTDASAVPFTNGSIYMYERPIPTSNPTYLIIHGTYYPKVLDGEGKPTYDANHNLIVDTTNPTDCYYRIDLTDDNGYYAIYRNFRYRIRITGVSKAGASTPAAAGSTGGSGDVSSNTEAQNLTDISDGYGRIMVEYTSKTLVEETTEVELKYKFIPDVEHDTPNNDAVTITIYPGGSAGDVIKNSTTISTTGKTTVGGNEGDHGIIVIDATDDPNDDFRTLRFSTTAPISIKKNQTIRISGHISETAVVYRDITYYLMERQNMAVSCTPSVEDVMGKQVNLNIGIPKDLPESMFPLIFNIEAEKLSLTPYIAPEWEDENLPVESGTTLVPNKSYPSFHFKRTLSYDEYTGTGLYAGKGLPDGDGGVVMTCHFKTNKDQSASNIYVSNEYFNKASTSFDNYHMYNFTGLKFNRNWLTAVDSPVTFSFYMDSADPQLETGRSVEVRLNGLVPANNDVLTPLPGTTDRYTYIHANSNTYVTFALKTERGFNGEYGVSLSSPAYNPASYTNTDLPKASFEGGSFSTVLYGNGWPTTFSFTIPDSFEMPGEGIDIELGLTNLIPNDGNITERNGKYYYHTTTKGAKTLNLKTANDRSAAVAVELNSDAFETLTSTQATRQYLNIAAGKITNVGPNNAFRSNTQNTVYVYTNKNSTGQVASYQTTSSYYAYTTNYSAANFASNIIDATTPLYLSMYSNYNRTTYRATTTAETLYNNGNATTVTFSNAAFGTRIVTIDTTDSNFSTGNSTYSLGDVTVTFSNLGEVDESFVYMIAGSTLTVSVPSGLHITDMTISYYSYYNTSYYPRTVNVSSGGGTYSNGTWTAANTSTTSVVLTMSNPRNNYILPSSIVVTVVEN